MLGEVLGDEGFRGVGRLLSVELVTKRKDQKQYKIRKDKKIFLLSLSRRFCWPYVRLQQYYDAETSSSIMVANSCDVRQETIYYCVDEMERSQADDLVESFL
jgi:hypothetical protein